VNVVVALLGATLGVPEPPAEVGTWNVAIAPIIASRCVSCHQKGGPAPFALQSYDDVSRRATWILEVVEQGIMPPWLPDESGVALAHPRALKKEEVARLAAWVKGAMPVGTGEPVVVALPSPPAFRVDASRQTSEDVVLPDETPAAYHTGEMDQHAFRLMMANAKPLRVQAVRGTSTAPQSVRVMTLVADVSGRVLALDREDPLVGWRMGADVGYTPAGAFGMLLVGGGPLRVPAGFHWAYEPYTDLSLGVHFRPTGMEETLRERLDVEFVDDDVQSRPLRWLPLVQLAVDVPAGERVEVTPEPLVVPAAVDCVALTPRAVELCTSLRVEAVFPNGTKRVLLSIPDWDHHRRETYVLSEPLRLPRGTIIQGTWLLDNTAENPRNPDDPPIDVARRRRAGILSVLLHAAAVDELDDSMLEKFGRVTLKRAQRR
jgi:hypothetical protein